MIRKRALALIIDSLLFAGLTRYCVTMFLWNHREHIDYPWTPVVLVLTLSIGYYFWSYRMGGGFGMAIMALTIVDDSRKKIGFVRYFMRSIHYVMFWVLYSIQFSMFLMGRNTVGITHDNWAKSDYGLRVFFSTVLLAIFLDKIFILWGHSQKSILEYMLKLNIVSYKS